MKSQNSVGYLIGATLPIIGLNIGTEDILIESYKITIPILLLICLKNTYSIKIKEFIYFLILTFHILIILGIALINNLNISKLTQSELQLIHQHIIVQFISIFIFSALLLFIVQARLKENFLTSIIQGYIYILCLHCVVAALILILEIIGIIPVELVFGLGLYKMKGILGEPKQFSAAMFSGYLLLKLSLNDAKGTIFKETTSRQLRKLFLVCGIISFSTSFIINYIIFLLFLLILKIKSKIKYYATIIIIFIVSALTIVSSSPCEVQRGEFDLGEGFSTIIAKVSTLQSAISFLPKDGLVLMDAACKPQEYIFGGGPGSLYRKLVSDDLSNYSWYSEIEIFREIINGESETRQGPSTLQIMLFSDYGLVGALLFLVFVTRLELRLERKMVMRKSLILVYFFIFINSMLYLWILMLMHLIYLRIESIGSRQ